MAGTGAHLGHAAVRVASGLSSRAVVTTTPRPIPLLKTLLADAFTVVSHAPTKANAANLARSFIAEMNGATATAHSAARSYGRGDRGTRRQSVATAMDRCAAHPYGNGRCAAHPSRAAARLHCRGGRSADHGHSLIGRLRHCHCGCWRGWPRLRHGRSHLQGRQPQVWARAVIAAYRDFQADHVVAEVNQGGDLVVQVLRQFEPRCRSAPCAPRAANGFAPSLSPPFTRKAASSTPALSTRWRTRCAISAPMASSTAAARPSRRLGVGPDRPHARHRPPPRHPHAWKFPSSHRISLIRFPVEARGMRAQNRGVSVSPDGKAPNTYRPLGPARFRDDKELRSPAHDTSAEQPAAHPTRALPEFPLPIAYLRWGEGRGEGQPRTQAARGLRFPVEARRMRAQNRDLSASPDGKAPEYVPTLRPARFRDDNELRSPAHDTSAELAACRAFDTSAAGIPLSPSLACDGERGGVRGSRVAFGRFPVEAHADSVSRSKRAECARRTGIFPCRLMGKLPNTYRPLRPARFRDDKELRLLPRPHPPNLQLAAHSTRALPESPLPIAYLLGERVGVRGSRELRLHADFVSGRSARNARAKPGSFRVASWESSPIRTDPAAGTFPGRQRAAITATTTSATTRSFRLMPRIPAALARLMPGFVRRPDTTKASATAALLSINSLGQPVWSPRDYAAFAREGFMQNAIVYRSVRMIAEAAASVPLLLYEGDRGDRASTRCSTSSRGPSPIRPAPTSSRAWYGFLLVAGNAYVEAVAVERRPARAARAAPRPHEGDARRRRLAGGLRVHAPAGARVRFAGEAVAGVRPILHVRLFHPAQRPLRHEPDRGGGDRDRHPQRGVRLEQGAARQLGAALGRAGLRRPRRQPDGRAVRAAEGASWSTASRARANAGRPLLLEGGLDWKPHVAVARRTWISSRPSTSPRARSRWPSACRRCCSASPATTPTPTTRRRNRAFWRQTVLPLVDAHRRAASARALARVRRLRAPRPLELRPDLDAIEALGAEREACGRAREGELPHPEREARRRRLSARSTAVTPS